jgi:hypothetical protein
MSPSVAAKDKLIIREIAISLSVNIRRNAEFSLKEEAQYQSLSWNPEQDTEALVSEFVMFKHRQAGKSLFRTSNRAERNK